MRRCGWCHLRAAPARAHARPHHARDTGEHKLAAQRGADEGSGGDAHSTAHGYAHSFPHQNTVNAGTDCAGGDVLAIQGAVHCAEYGPGNRRTDTHADGSAEQRI